MGRTKTMELSGSALVEKLRVAAMIVSRGEAGEPGAPILAVFNEKWGAFTLPMSKVRSWEFAGVRGAETPKDAALRGAAESMGRSFAQPEHVEPLGVLPPEKILSARSMDVKEYDIEVFRVWVEPDAEPEGLGVARWWPVDWFLDPDRKPISETARHIIKMLRKRGQV
jgi:hypothetical protein